MAGNSSGGGLGNIDQLMKQIQFGANKGGGMGAQMGMMGLPFFSRSGGAAPWLRYDTRTQSVYGPGGVGGGGGGTTPPNDPNNPSDPNDPGFPGDKYKKNLIPDWWRQWYNEQGRYGGLPPVQGLL